METITVETWLRERDAVLRKARVLGLSYEGEERGIRQGKATTRLILVGTPQAVASLCQNLEHAMNTPQEAIASAMGDLVEDMEEITKRIKRLIEHDADGELNRRLSAGVMDAERLGAWLRYSLERFEAGEDEPSNEETEGLYLMAVDA